MLCPLPRISHGVSHAGPFTGGRVRRVSKRLGLAPETLCSYRCGGEVALLGAPSRGSNRSHRIDGGEAERGRPAKRCEE